MSKKTAYKKSRQNRREDVIIRVAIIAVAILAVLLVVAKVLDKEESVPYFVTEDGHVHAADGTHLGTIDEMFGDIAADASAAPEAAEGTATETTDEAAAESTETDSTSEEPAAE